MSTPGVLQEEKLPAPLEDVARGAAPGTTDPGAEHWDLHEVVAGLHAVRDRWRQAQGRTKEAGGREFPSREALARVVEQLCGALFPMRLGPTDLRQECEDFYVGHTLDAALNLLVEQVRLELAYQARHAGDDEAQARSRAAGLVRAFAATLPETRAVLDTDVEAAFRGDPAARSVDEIVLCYPGIHAVIHYRIAHRLYELGVPLLARIVAELAHSATGIDIHPGAQIGHSFFIDHGTGVVIGETAVIGNRVRLYQAVTLGAKRFEVGEDGGLAKGLPRHPRLEDDVVVYAGATILGRIVIGQGASIGGNVWLTHSVPPGSHITQASLQHAESGKAGRAP